MANEIQQTTRSGTAEAPQKKDRTKSALPQVEGSLIDTDHGAALLGVSRRTFQGEVAARKIACIKIGRSVRFHPDDIAAYIQSHRIQPIGWKNSTGRATA